MFDRPTLSFGLMVAVIFNSSKGYLDVGFSLVRWLEHFFFEQVGKTGKWRYRHQAYIQVEISDGCKVK